MTAERLNEPKPLAVRRFEMAKDSVLARASTKASSNLEEASPNLGQKVLGAASRVATTAKANALGAVAAVTPVDTVNSLRTLGTLGEGAIDRYRNARDGSLPYGSRPRAVAIGLGAVASAGSRKVKEGVANVWNRMRGKAADGEPASPPARQGPKAAELAGNTARQKAREAAVSGQQGEKSEPSDTGSIDALLKK